MLAPPCEAFTPSKGGAPPSLRIPDLHDIKDIAFEMKSQASNIVYCRTCGVTTRFCSIMASVESQSTAM